MSHQIHGRHIIGGIALAALFSLPFDAMIVNATITDIRMEQALRAAAKRAADRAIADTVSAAPQPDQSATTSTFGSRSEDGPEESPLAAGGAAVSREDGSSKAGETATSGLGTASRNDPERRGNQGVTAGETARSARSSSLPTLRGRAEWVAMASAQSVRSERSPLETHRRTVFSGSEQKASGGRSLHSMADAAATLCGVPSQLYRDLIARESSWRVDAVSAAGAVGLAQVMPRSARDVSPTLDVRDPWQNLVAGACLLRQYRDRFGSWRVALHAYHGGPTRVDRRRVAQSSRNYAQDVIGGNE